MRKNSKYTWLSVMAIVAAICGYLLYSFFFSGKNELTSIIIEARLNPSLSQDIILQIEDDSIKGQFPLNTSIQELIPTITSSGGAVSIDGQEYIPTTKAYDFSRPILISTFSKRGKRRDYNFYTKYFNGLPVVLVYTDGGAPIVSRTSHINANVKIIGDALLSDFIPVKIKGRGNSTWGFPKRSYQLKFDEKLPVLGMNNGRRWLLIANITDKTMLRNRLAFDLSRASRLAWTPDDRFVDLFLNNEYEGTYQLSEKVEESVDRLDIGEDGVLLESDVVTKLKPNDIIFKTERELFQIKEPSVKLGDTEYRAIEARLQEAEQVLFSKNFADPSNGYQKYFDVESFVDWYLINEIARNNDAIFHTSVNLHYKIGDKIKMGPVWDFDITFGNINYRDNEKIEGFYVNSSPWYQRLFSDPAFVEKVKERYPYFHNKQADFLRMIDENADLIRSSQKVNFQKWPILGQMITPNPVAFPTYQEEVDYLKRWLTNRMDWMDQAIKEL